VTSKRLAIVLSGAFFVSWLAILYAGADHPPPVGFLWVVLLDLVCAGFVYLRVPTYVAWSAARSSGRWLRAFFDGLVAGLVIALVTMVLNPNGEPSVQPTWIDRTIWLGVLATVGAANSMFLRFCSSLVNRRSRTYGSRVDWSAPSTRAEPERGVGARALGQTAIRLARYKFRTEPVAPR